ncbi:hypothetical protein Ctob_002531 [Chrysochromulina tobinii]|uniref:Uncharacterized protein n=1 Tax=Chrysochromulina tobinii TaxID=1460289 RepID=A0A0M0JNM4_9EUKA|nr:hypothetical protein Ctob_002531 [Chrysochromulina tobinii]|eukprot:KOO27912.1 hypothetical protein Ctob_002531 [Chrysochromulina sp. CCMP291]
MKDETIAHLIQLLSDKQAEYKTALAKKDETIERLIQLLSDKQLRDAPAVGMRYHLRGYDYDLCQAEYDKLSEFEKCQYEAMAPH